MEPENFTDFTKKYECLFCDIKCSRKTEWDRHVLTLKHKKRQNGSILEENFTTVKKNSYTCHCKKIYKTHSGLWKHKQQCLVIDSAEDTSTSTSTCTSTDDKQTIQILIKENTDFKNIILELVKNNGDLQKQMMQVCENIQPTNINSHNNSHNKTFNLQFFLNEQCKDAMNIMDFVNSVTLQLSDLESVGKLGYVEGISNIMIKKLTEMDIYKRPVHCSDAKRETLYVKDNNIWEKENETHSKLRRAIKYISKKNSDLLLAWSNEHPASKNIHSKQNEEYMKMIYQAMGGTGEVEENENKIIKKISKMVLIEKNNN